MVTNGTISNQLKYWFFFSVFRQKKTENFLENFPEKFSENRQKNFENFPTKYQGKKKKTFKRVFGDVEREIQRPS